MSNAVRRLSIGVSHVIVFPDITADGVFVFSGTMT